MEGEAPPPSAIPEPETYGPEYEKLMKERQDLNEMKSAINKVNRCSTYTNQLMGTRF